MPREAASGRSRPTDGPVGHRFLQILPSLEALLASIVAVGEIGDKTQPLALMLAVRLRRPVPIVFGILVATLGMLIADVPVVLLGNIGARRIPFKLVRRIAAALFALMGVIALVGPLPG